MTDADLMHRAKNGDQSAYHELVNRHAPGLFRLAFSLVNNASDAEDVVQETFSGAFRQLRKFEGRSTVKTWLTRIAVKQAARCRRTRKRHSMPSLEELPEGAGAAALHTGPKADMRIDIPAVLEKLPDIHREVVVLREMHGMSYEEIAEVIGVPRGTVESRLFRARQELKQLLRDYLP